VSPEKLAHVSSIRLSPSKSRIKPLPSHWGLLQKGSWLLHWMGIPSIGWGSSIGLGVPSIGLGVPSIGLGVLKAESCVSVKMKSLKSDACLLYQTRGSEGSVCPCTPNGSLLRHVCTSSIRLGASQFSSDCVKKGLHLTRHPYICTSWCLNSQPPSRHGGPGSYWKRERQVSSQGPPSGSFLRFCPAQEYIEHFVSHNRTSLSREQEAKSHATW
jgi:hypothetical protein